MIDPITALTSAFAIALIFALLFWPDKGMFWQLKIGRQASGRVMMEDALKQLYDHEYRNKPGTLKSISGALELTQDKTTHLLEKLITMKLVVFNQSKFSLTNDGRTYALRIIRMHRLWERYFADETGLTEMEWHKQAELREHTTTIDQAEQLARYMGHPSFDPHGDPIPTAKGEIPPQKGMPLTKMQEGNLALIIHIEDEPAAIYAQLVAEGLNPGMQIHLLKKSPSKIRFLTEGEEIVLAPVVAENITVLDIPREQEMEIPSDSLADLNVGEAGEVVTLSKACRGMQRRRLMDLGIVPGTIITNELSSPGGNPVAYNIRGAIIALRKNQARHVRIKKSKTTKQDV
jgi:DtxR family transcriptional regulator, Mn-dependent transcriptional regulator